MFYKSGYIQIFVKIKFVLDFAPHYAWVMDGKFYNMRTGRFIKQTTNNGSIVYIIDGKPYGVNKLREHLIKQK